VPPPGRIGLMGSPKHIMSHYRVNSRFLVCNLYSPIAKKKGQQREVHVNIKTSYPDREIGQLPLSSLQRMFSLSTMMKINAVLLNWEKPQEKFY